MKWSLIAFLVTLYFVFTHINCDDTTVNYFINNNKNFTLSNNNLLLEKSYNNNSFKILPSLISSSLNNNSSSIEEAFLSGEEKGKLCLENVTKCMENDLEYEETTSKLSNLLFSSLPPFDLSNVIGVSQACQKQSQKYVNDLGRFKLWALQMYDSTAKIPSGILNGNVNQLGDFDMCLGANLKEPRIFGKYCLASLEVQIPNSQYLAGLHKLVQSHYHFKSRLEDPGHRVPRFSSINWALCVPNACSPKDVNLGLKKVVKNLVRDTEIEVRIEVDPSMCQTLEKPVPSSTYLGLCGFFLVLLIILVATGYDYYYTSERRNEWILAFSFRKNVNSLVSMKRSSNDIEAVHGIRCLNAILLLLAHKSMALFFLPYANRTESAEYLGRPFTVIGRAASLFTDPFIMFSGALTAYSLLAKLERSKRLNIFEEYVSRLMRIVPTFAALIAFCTFVLPWLGSGPMWNLVVTQHSDICKQNWWRNLLFIHNYFGFKEMCLTHTHHVGIDTQLFFASPFLIYLVWRWPKNGAIILFSLGAISTIMRYYVTYTMRLSNYVHFGTSIKQLFETADNMYILPAHRATVYIMGIFLGYILRNYRHLTLTKTQISLGNALALVSFSASFFGPSFMSKIDYVYNPTHAAWYAAFAPILWCWSFAWIIFTSHLGYKSVLGNFFSHPVFTLWTKVSYTVYLTQFPIYFFNVGQTRSPENYGFFRQMLNLKEFVWVFGLSALLTLMFEMPFQNVRNIIFKSNKIATATSKSEKKIE